jgi:hypothetical protein
MAKELARLLVILDAFGRVIEQSYKATTSEQMDGVVLIFILNWF